MERIDGEDIDYFLLQIEEVFNEAADRENDDGEWMIFSGFRIWVPKIFSLADQESASEIFWSEYRPDIMLFTDKKTEGVTLQTLGGMGIIGAGGGHPIESVKQLLETIDDRNVYYDMGVTDGNVKIYWIEYKSFAGEERVYNLLFLFQTEAGDILGTFYCIFEEYEKWKPIAWEMIQSIREEPDEGI